jgi:hypothetical protein
VFAAYEQRGKAHCHTDCEGQPLLIATCAVELHTPKAQLPISNVEVPCCKHQFATNADTGLLGVYDFASARRSGSDDFLAVDKDREC